VLGHQTGGSDHPVEGRDPMQVAVFPLAVPYLLNPAGIVVLVTLSAEASSIAVLAVAVGVLVAVLAFDVLVFRERCMSAASSTRAGCWLPRRCSASCWPRSEYNWSSTDCPMSV